MTSRASGFTLLEMLVAMAILSLAALALVRLDAFTARSSANLTQRSIAQVTADNAAITLLTDARAPSVGTQRTTVTNAGIAWTVDTTVAPTADSSLLRIDIRVSSPDGVAATLTSIRPAT